MITLIDYYSFTIPLDRPLGEGMFNSDQDFAIKTFSSIDALQSVREQLSTGWEAEGAKGFYKTRLRHTVTDATIAFGSVNPHLFVELAGKACANFDAINILNPLIAATHERTTRIDFAVDIKTATFPKDFIEKRSNKSFKSSGNRYSPTGGTEYLGGRSSERMARVYRYYAPHPRHEYLRVEAEYKGDAAKASAKHLSIVGLEQATLDAHQPFGWEHFEWNTGNILATRITYKTYRNEDASTLRWIYGDVVTAIRKAQKAGILDLDEWLEFLRKEPKDEN